MAPAAADRSVGALAVVALIAAALIPSGGSDGAKPFGVAAWPGTLDGATACPSTSRRCSARTSRRRPTGPQIARAGEPGHRRARAARLGPSPDRRRPRSTAPIAAFRAMPSAGPRGRRGGAAALRTALARRRSRAAPSAPGASRTSDYLHLGAVYGLLPATLDARDRRDARRPGPRRPGPAVSPGSTGSSWGCGRARRRSPSSARRRSSSTRRRTLRRALPDGPDRPARLRHPRARDPRGRPARLPQRRPHVPWSGAGVLATAAGLAATQEVIATLTPLLRGPRQHAGRRPELAARGCGARCTGSARPPRDATRRSGS